ncbi:MAG: AI-2E family transporter [Usitatibacter sp.]
MTIIEPLAAREIPVSPAATPDPVPAPAAPDQVPAPAAPDPIPAPARSPTDVGIAVIAILAVVTALYLARAFFVPLLLGILGSYALSPLVDWLRARGIPRAGGAALVLSAVVAGLTWVAFFMGDDAASMIQKLPEAARKVREHVGRAQADGPTAMQKLQEAATELQHAASDVAGEKAAPKRPGPKAAARDAEPSVWVRDYMLAQSRLLFTVVAQAPFVLLLCYFLLASGEHFRRKLVQLVGPSLTRKKEAVRILEEVDSQVQGYLLVTVAGNVALGLVTWLAFELLGVEHAGVWGIAAGVLHFIPYLGPMVFAVASGAAAFMQFGSALAALTVAGASLLIAAAIGSLIMTWVQGHFARVNAAVLFIALLFFGWLWGIWGLLLGAPLVAIAKVVCDRVEALKPAGELLGR